MFMRIMNRAEEAGICILLVTTTALVFLDVVMRFGFNTGFMWTQELTLHMSAWFVLFGASYGLKVGSHIGMDAFIKLFPRTVRRWLSSIAAVLAITYCGLIFYGSWVYLKKMKMIGIDLEDLPIPTWIAHGLLLFGFGFLIIRLLIILWSIITDKADGFKHADEAKESMALAEKIEAEEAL